MYKEVLTYNEILEYIMRNEEQDDDQAIVWKFKRIPGHQDPLKKDDPGYNGSKFNVLVEWETKESTYEPLNVIAADNPVTCAIYTKEKGLLNEQLAMLQVDRKMTTSHDESGQASLF